MIEQQQQQAATPRWFGNSLRWLTGYCASVTCTEIFYVALGWIAAQITSPSNVALVLLANVVPQALLLLVGGVLADRIGPKPIAVVADLARFVLMLIAGFAVLHGVTVEMLVLIAVLFGVADGFFLPAVGTMPAFLGPDDAQTRLQGMKSAAFRLSSFVGAPLAGIAIARQSVSATFWLTAVLFLVSVVALTATRLPRLPDVSARVKADPVAWRVRLRQAREEVTVGLRVVKGDPAAVGLVASVAVVTLGFCGPILAGLPLLATAKQWGPSGVGWTVGAFGVGGIATAVLITVLGKPRRPGLFIILGVLLVGVGLGSVAVGAGLEAAATGQAVAVAGGFLAGVGGSLSTPLTTTALIEITPKAHLGKVMSVLEMASFTIMPLSLILTGFLVDATGPAVPFVVSGVLLVVAAVALLCYRPVRQMGVLPA